MSHTPGPWRLCPHLADERIDQECPCEYGGDISNSRGNAIVFFGTCHDRMKNDDGCGCQMVSRITDREEQKATARLIAAAPDLLAACELAVEHGWPQQQQPSECQHCRKTFDAMEVAIAKAKGESS